MLYTIYVDSLFGSDTNTGELDSPVRTLSYALSQVYDGGIIVIQGGDGLSYGDLVVSKNVTIKSAYGAFPIVGKLTISGVQVLIENLSFNEPASGIEASNLNTGSIIVRGCRFETALVGISIDAINYVSLHRNYFYDFQSAILINAAEEVCASSNIFSNGMRSIDITTVGRLDLWRNTVYGAIDLPVVPNPDTNLRIIYKTLTSFDVIYKRLQLPGFASLMSGGGYEVGFNVVNGPSFNYGTDFTVALSGSMISWDGLQLEQEFAVGDVVRVMYSETGDLDPGDAIRVQNVGDENSRIDSNSISAKPGVQIATGVTLNTPVKVQYNNFDDVLVWWGGTAPTGETGIGLGATGLYNIGETAMYRDPLSEDFRLQQSSPNIDSGDYNRWYSIYNEIGISKVIVGGHWRYTASYTGIRTQVSPFDRDLDYDLFHRGATGIQGLTGDIGAYEFNHNETAMGNYVAEYGFDQAYPGTETGPYAIPDRGFQRSGSNDLYIDTNAVPFQGGETGFVGVTGPYQYASASSSYGKSYSRYRSRDIVLSGSDLVVGSRTRNDVAVIYPSHPSLETGLTYVSPDGSDTGSVGSITSPYRTMGRALQEGNPYIMVEPGYYPSFRGESGINIVGIERFKGVGFSGMFYSNMRDGSWTGTGTYSYGKNTITLSSPANIHGSFSFSDSVDTKVFASVESDTLTIKMFNNDNNVYVKINRSLSVITYGYTTDGVNYEVNKFISEPYTPEELFSDLKVRFVIKDNRFSIYIHNSYISGSYTNNFISGSLITDWVIQFMNTGSGTDAISNLSAFSSLITGYSGAIGVTGVFTLKKLFAITGATGIQG